MGKEVKNVHLKLSQNNANKNRKKRLKAYEELGKTHKLVSLP